MHDLTPRTVVDRRRLRLPLPGEPAFDEGEYALGVCCLATAVVTGDAVGAVAVISAPARVHSPRVQETLRSGAGRVSRALAMGASAN
jgi:IclR family acetate operon transcriptional repressor